MLAAGVFREARRGSRKEFFFFLKAMVDFCCGEEGLSRLEDGMAHTIFSLKGFLSEW